MNQADLAAAMSDLGVPWKRATVVNLETRAADSRGKGHGRDAVTVQELLALAQVLDVPPPLLLADPTVGAPVPVTPEREVDPWSALLWLLGGEPLGEETARWLEAARPAVLGLQISLAVDDLLATWSRRSIKAMALPDEALPEEEAARQDRRSLQGLSSLLYALSRYQTPPPPIVARVMDRAAELDVKLPGMGV